jgi:DNA polymerase I-like protein with 3'-5' exonuclease and polymerase domains
MVYTGEYTYVTTPDLIPQIAREVEAAPVIGLDIETTAFKAFEGQIRLIQVSTGEKIYVVDCFKVPKEALNPLIRAIASPTIKVIQNARFEQAWFLHHHNVELWPVFDPFRASSLLYNGWVNVSHNLDALYNRELQPLGCTPSKVMMGGSDWSAPELSKRQLDYAAEDVGWLHELRDVLKQKLVEAGLIRVALIEFGACLPEAAIENTGFFLNRHKWVALYENNFLKRKACRDALLKILPHPSGMLSLPGLVAPWNVDSTQQMGKALRSLGVRVPSPSGQIQLIGDTYTDRKTGKTKTIGTNELLLAQVADKYDCIPPILEYRGYNQRVKSFGPAYLEHINSITGRVHTHFFPFTATGRYATSAPQLHNVPRDAAYRDCFEAEPGNILVAADYSGIEMCIAAEISGDETLIRVFQEAKDAHRFTASIVSGKPEDQITKEERQQAKPINFGLVFGMMPEKLVIYAKANYGVNMTLAQAKTFHKRYFGAYSGIASWHDFQLREGARLGEVRTLSGRRRFVSEHQHNELLNTPIQGTAADALKSSLRNVHLLLKKYGGDVKGIVHHVHDEITVECKDDPELVDAVKQDLQAGMKESMEQFLKRVPVVVDPASGKTWASVH